MSYNYLVLRPVLPSHDMTPATPLTENEPTISLYVSWQASEKYVQPRRLFYLCVLCRQYFVTDLGQPSKLNIKLFVLGGDGGIDLTLKWVHGNSHTLRMLCIFFPCFMWISLLAETDFRACHFLNYFRIIEPAPPNIFEVQPLLFYFLFQDGSEVKTKIVIKVWNN